VLILKERVPVTYQGMHEGCRDRMMEENIVNRWKIGES
jgi:hypothetical protein